MIRQNLYMEKLQKYLKLKKKKKYEQRKIKVVLSFQKIFYLVYFNEEKSKNIRFKDNNFDYLYNKLKVCVYLKVVIGMFLVIL